MLTRIDTRRLTPQINQPRTVVTLHSKIINIPQGLNVNAQHPQKSAYQKPAALLLFLRCDFIQSVPFGDKCCKFPGDWFW